MSALLETDAVILGSGASLLNLTNSQRETVANHHQTLGMNKFLLFHDLLQIIPKCVFLADSHFPAQRVARDTILAAKKAKQPVKLFLNQDYKRYFSYSLSAKDILRRVKSHYALTRDYRYLSGASVFYSNICFFKSNPRANNRDLFWADCLDQELYFHRGSLTTAINLVDVIFKPKRIILLGIDLNSPKSFFSDDPRLVKYEDKTYQHLETTYGLHATACPHPNATPVQESLREIALMLQKKNVQLLSGNPRSLLCELKICESVTIS